MPMTQKQFIHDFIEQTVPKYNEELFTRSDEQIISSLENIILLSKRGICYSQGEEIHCY